MRIDAPFPGLSYNYVAPVTRADGTPAVLKLWFPFETEFNAEVEALRLYDGDGAVRLLDVDTPCRAMLLERAEPGMDLWQLADQTQQIEVAASLMRRLWRPPPPGCTLPLATAQWQRMLTTAPQLARSSFPLHRVADSKVLFDELAAASPPAVLHEDIHQANILAAVREPWLAIDPHGLIGPPVAGWLVDATDSYTTAIVVAALLSGAGTLVLRRAIASHRVALTPPPPAASSGSPTDGGAELRAASSTSRSS